ncbi:hypothetical protein [Mahella australiensis]|uniref:hypothetical protein n=1 Tax=Mahella australiensis TaxID=252966 RepID=UPI0002D5EC3B|nr:hypothetical protein [Mahella australiensis]
MTITELVQEIHTNAKKHGWWDEDRSFGDVIALCHSELSEFYKEAIRRGYYGRSAKMGI